MALSLDVGSIMQKITPNLWFPGTAPEAAEFYARTFPDAEIVDTTFYPSEGLLDFQTDLADRELTIDVDLGSLQITCINAGPEISINASISLILNFDPATDDEARTHLDQMWSALKEGGTELMPLGQYPFSPHYGWVQDRFGMTWQLMFTDPAGEPRPFIIPSLMFGGPAQNRAEEARDLYVSLLPESRAGMTSIYPEQTGPAPAGTMVFGDFQLADQWFAAMNPGMEQDFTFSEGVSLSVACDGQEELDRLWNELSADPTAEQCGWCKDRFGVSWQLVPANIGELMQRPGAFGKLMEMKRINISQF